MRMMVRHGLSAAVLAGVMLGLTLGLLASHADDYAATHWYGHVFYMYHKQRHSSPAFAPTYAYSLDDSMAGLSPNFTLAQARSTISSATDQWNSGSGNRFRFSHWVEGASNVLYEDSWGGELASRCGNVVP